MRADRRPRRPLGRRLGITLTAAVVALAVGFAALVAGLVALGHDRSRVADHIDPAVFESGRVRAALVSEEAAVHGYALSHDASFVDRYQRALADQATADHQLRTFVPAEPGFIRAADDVADASRAWQTDAAAALLAAPDTTTGPDAAVLQRSQTEFDAVQARLDDLTATTDSLRAAARARFDRSASLVDFLLGAVIALVLIVAGVIWFGLRRVVLAPLASLADDAKAVADGDLRHEVVAAGHGELESVARAVEAMRRRVVDDLAAVQSAHAELARSNAELEQFAYVASHDLQEPLRKVASFCQLLEQRYSGQLDDRGEQYIAFAVDGAKRMQTLINDLLAFSRVGRTTDRFVPVDLKVVARQVLVALEPAIEDAHATVHVGELPVVQGDPSLLAAVLQNLIGNGVKFASPDNPSHVELSAVRRDDEWLFTCADNGIGIEPRFSERVFVIFQRLHGRDEYEGTGIGLALCRKIIEYHGGRIWVDTNVERGSVFHFTLPVTHGADPTEANGSPMNGALIEHARS